MPIKLNIVKPKTSDQLRAEHIALHDQTTAKLEGVLRDLIAKHRDQYQRHIAQSLVGRVSFYVESREDGQTVEEFYRKRLKDSPVWRQVAHEVRELLRALTDYDDSLTMAKWDGRAGKYSTFAVNLKPDAADLAYKLAEPRVEEIVQTFLYRAKDKLVDLMVAYPAYEAKLISGGFSGGLFQGSIGLRFDRPDLTDKIEAKASTFTIRFGAKWNTSVLGNPYVQYPFTFHDYVIETTVLDMGNKLHKTDAVGLSEEGLKQWFKFDAWKAPVPKVTRFKQVGTGSVIVGKDGTLAMCLRTGKDKVTKQEHAVVHFLKDGKAVKNDWKADHFDRVVAEIKNPHTGYGQQKDSCVVYFNEGTERMEFEPTEAERKLDWKAREKLIREKAFAALSERKAF